MRDGDAYNVWECAAMSEHVNEADELHLAAPLSVSSAVARLRLAEHQLRGVRAFIGMTQLEASIIADTIGRAINDLTGDENECATD